MSANKFKVGDKVKIREGLTDSKLYSHARIQRGVELFGGKTLTIKEVRDDYYIVEETYWVWDDQILQPAEKTLYDLCAGDFIRSDIQMRKVLAAVDGCYLISKATNYRIAADVWYTAYELDDLGYRPAESNTPEPTIEINGKKYKKSDVEKAIKDLEPIE